MYLNKYAGEDIGSSDMGFEDVKPVEGIKLSVWNAILHVGTLIAFYWSGYT